MESFLQLLVQTFREAAPGCDWDSVVEFLPHIGQAVGSIFSTTSLKTGLKLFRAIFHQCPNSYG